MSTLRDPEKSYNQKYYEEHKEYFSEKNKEWTAKNRSRRNELHKRYRDNNKDKVNKSTHDAMFKRWYGITRDEFKQICADQNHLCKICGKKKKLVCDHNHSTGKVRAALCNNCNVMIAHAYEDQLILANAIIYIKEYNA